MQHLFRKKTKSFTPKTLNLRIDSWDKQKSIFLQPQKQPIDKIENQESQFGGEMVWTKEVGVFIFWRRCRKL